MPPNESDPTAPKDPDPSEPMAAGPDSGPPVEEVNPPGAAEADEGAAASSNGESHDQAGDGDGAAAKADDGDGGEQDQPDGGDEVEQADPDVADDANEQGQAEPELPEPALAELAAEQTDGDDEEIVMLDDDAIEELDEDDLVIEEDEQDSVAPPAPPPMAVGMPPKPPTQPPPIAGGPEPAELAIAADATGAALASEAEGAAPPMETESAAAAEDPLDESIEVPTVLDRLIANQDSESAEEQAETLNRELEGSSSKERIGALAYELGELCERVLADEARAVKAFGRALQADPSLRPNLWAIRRVFYRRKLWPNLVKLISAESRLAPDDSARADLLVEKAHILEDRMGDSDQAFQVYDEAVSADPHCMAALTGLERLALARGDHAQIERSWSLLAQAVETPTRRQAYLLDLVRLLGERGGDDIDKARQYLERAAELGGSSEALSRAREWLAEMSGESVEMLDALDARATDMMARFGPAGPTLADPDKDGAREAHSEAEAVLRRQLVSLRRRQARMAAHQAGDADRAWSYLQQAMTLAPGDALVVADLADLAERLGRYDELAELVEGWEAQADDPDQALRLSLRRATALFRAGQKASARALLATLAATQPPYLSILAVRESDALAAGDAQALAETYQSCGEAAQKGTGFGPGAASEPNAAVAAGYLLAAGDLYRYRVGDREAAIARYRQALEVQPGFASAVLALAGAYENARDLAQAIEHCQSHLAGADDALAVHLLERLADLHQQVGDTDSQRQAIERLIERQPDNLAHRWRYERVLEQLGRHQDRAGALTELADKLSDPDSRAAVLVSAARSLDRAGDPQPAIPLYRQIIELWPQDGYAREALADALRRSGQWQQLIDELHGRAPEQDDADAVRSLREAASVALDHLDQPERAAALLGELVDRAPTDADALAMLGEAQLRAGHGQAALEALERECQVRGGDTGEAQALCRYANLAESMGLIEQAEDAYRRALDLEPESGLAAAGLLEMAARRGNPLGEADALAQLSRAEVAQSLAADLCERAGWLIASTDDGDMTRAGELFERASSLDPSRRGALLGRVLVEARGGDPFAMGEALSALARTLGASYAAASLQLRAAVLAEVHGDENGQSERIRRALAAAATDPGTLVAGAEYLPLPGLQLAEDTRAFDEAGRQADLFGARAELASDPASRADWQLGSAELLESLGRLNDALAIVSKVLRQREDDLRALQLLRRICQRGGDRAALARTSAQLARLIGDSSGKLGLLREAAEIFDRELNQPEAAVPVYRRILAEDPGAAEWQRLHDLLSEHGDRAGLYEILSERIHHLESDGDATAQRTRLLVERARLRSELNDGRGAGRDLDAALLLDSRHSDALFWRGLSLRDDKPERAAQLLETFLEVSGEDPRLSEVELALSEVLAGQDDLAGAVVQLDHLVRQTPDDTGVRERLIEYLIRAQEYRRASEELHKLEGLRKEPADKIRDQLRMASLLTDNLSDRDGAAAALERARELDPLAIEPVRRLVELFEGERRLPILQQAASALRQAIAAEPGKPTLYERLAAVASWQGDAVGRAMALQAQAAIGSIPAEHRDIIAGWTARIPTMLEQSTLGDPLHPTDWEALVDPGDGGGYAELWSLFGWAVAESLPTELAQLGFGRGDRIKGKELDQKYPRVIGLLRALGSGEPEVYVSADKPGYARALCTSKPVLLLGKDVAEARKPAQAFLLARATTFLHRGTGALPDLEDDEVVAWFAAAASVAEVKIADDVRTGLDSRLVAERSRALAKHLGRRERKALAGHAEHFAAATDPATWRRAALRTGARAGLVVCADVSAALDMLDLGRGGRSLTDDAGSLSLFSFAVSAQFLQLRRRLGLVDKT